MTFEEYLERRGAWLPRFARVLCGDRTLAEDVLQEVLLRAHGRWDRIGAMEYPDAYLRRMIVNEHLRWRRRFARQILVADVEPGSDSPDHADRVSDRDHASALIATLPPRQRAAIVLRYFSDLSDDDIAQTMGCSPGTVRSHLSRALASMRVNAGGPALEIQKG